MPWLETVGSGDAAYVAFYSYCKEDNSEMESVLDTNVMFDSETICRGTYTYDTQPLGETDMLRCQNWNS